LVTPPVNVATGATTPAVVGGWVGRKNPTPMPTLAESVPLLVMPPVKIDKASTLIPIARVVPFVIAIVPLLTMPLVMTEFALILMPAPVPRVIAPALDTWPVIVLALVTRMPVGPAGPITPVVLLTTLPENDVLSTVMQLSAPELLTGKGPV
jgi:hypothetical protein